MDKFEVNTAMSLVQEAKELQSFQNSVSKLKEELEEHLFTINENTSEIQSSFSVLQQLELKIDKLSARIDELASNQPAKKDFYIKPLTKKEKDIFRVLYEISQDHEFITYKFLSKKLTWPESLVQSYISNLIEKGIPLSKRFVGRIVHLKLDKEFKEQHAKRNFVGLNTKLTYWMK